MDSFSPSEPSNRRCILICQHRSCLRSGAAEVFRRVSGPNRPSPVFVAESGCMSQCSVGPNVRIMPDGVSYCRIKPSDVATIVAEHLESDRPVQSLLIPACMVTPIWQRPPPPPPKAIRPRRAI